LVRFLSLSDFPIFGTRVPGAPYRLRPSAYALVRNEVGLFAIVRTPLACYLPGGGMEAGENPEQTIIREAREECGFILDAVALVGRAMEICYSIEEGEYFEKDSFFIEATIAGHGPQTELDHELIWMDAAKAREALSHGSHRWAVHRALESSSSS